MNILLVESRISSSKTPIGLHFAALHRLRHSIPFSSLSLDPAFIFFSPFFQAKPIFFESSRNLQAICLRYTHVVTPAGTDRAFSVLARVSLSYSLLADLSFSSPELLVRVFEYMHVGIYITFFSSIFFLFLRHLSCSVVSLGEPARDW